MSASREMAIALTQAWVLLEQYAAGQPVTAEELNEARATIEAALRAVTP